jgi:hypothetical protein
VSRLAGDPWIGEFFSTQALFVIFLGIGVGRSDAKLLALAVLLFPLGLVSVMWTPSREGPDFVARVFGFEVLRVRLNRTTRFAFLFGIAAGMPGRTLVPSIENADVKSCRLPFVVRRRRIVLRAAMYLTPGEVEQWVEAIENNSPIRVRLPESG